jgi:hypothetical protein
MWRCSDELRVKADKLHRSSKKDTTKYYIGTYTYLIFYNEKTEYNPMHVLL